MSEARVSVAHSRVEIERLVRGAATGRNWRDALLRRILALADAAAVLLVSLFFLAVGAGWHLTVWSAALLPMWMLLAKLVGLYDNDHRALRHLTADEFGQLFTWAVRGTVVACLILYWLPAASITVARAVEMAAIVLVADSPSAHWAVICWRRRVPPERTMIVGTGAIAEATRRKIELFPDIHVQLVPCPVELGADEPENWVRGVDRIILASQQIDEEQIAELVGSVPRASDQAQRHPAGARHVRHRRAAEPRRRPAGHRVQHVGRLAFDAAAEAEHRPRSSRCRRSSCSARSSWRSRSRSAGQPRPGRFRAAARGPRRAAVPDVQVPHDGRGRGGAAHRARLDRRPPRADVQAPGRSARDPRRPLPAPHEPRRAAAALQRAARAT